MSRLFFLQETTVMPRSVPSSGLLALLVMLAAGSACADDGHLRYLPSDTKLVLTIHADVLGQQEKTNGDEPIRRLYFGKLAPELDRSAKLPITEVHRAVLASPYAGTLSGVTVLRGKIDRKLFEKQLRAAAKRSKALTVEEMGKPAVPVFRRKLEESLWTDLFPQLAAVPSQLRKLVAPTEVYVAAVDDETLFVSLAGKAQMVRALRARPAGTAPRIADELTRLLRKQDPKDVAAFAMLDDSLNPAVQLVVQEKVKETFEQFEHITARVRRGKDVEIVIEVKGKSSDVTGELATKSHEALKQLRGNLARLVLDEKQRDVVEALLKGFRVSRKATLVTLTGKLSEEHARKLLPVVK
jgi:hypothetical protein